MNVGPATEIVIREGGPGDAAGWATLRFALWPDDGEQHLATEARRFFEVAARGPGVMPEAVFVAVDPEANSRVVGFAEISRRLYAEGCDTSPVGFLEGWYVAPEYRRHGLGRRLVEAAEAWALELGCSEFASDALVENDVSAQAHRALGFEEVEVIRCFRKDLKS